MRSFFSSTRVFLGVTGLCAALFLTACNKFDNDSPDNNAPLSALMAFNLAPSKTVTVALDRNALTNVPLAYTSFTGGYLSIYSGNRLFTAFNYNGGDSIASSNYSFATNKYYSAFVLGANNNFRNVIVRDNFDSLSVASGEAYVRYINAIPDSSAPNVTIAVNGNNVVNQSAAYASISDFKAITPGQVSIAISNGTNINKSRTITLEQKKAYTVLLVGIPGSVTSDSVQVKFIENGTLAGTAQRASASAARSAN